MNLPNLLDICNQYVNYLSAVPVKMNIDDRLHKEGEHSVYLLTVKLLGDQQQEFYYIGRTINAKRRASQHKSSFTKCRISTFVGLSVLYCPIILANLARVEMSLEVKLGGLSIKEAKKKEKELSSSMRLLYGNAVITNPA